MTWSPAFPYSKRLFRVLTVARVLTVVVVAVSLPMHVSAQTTVKPVKQIRKDDKEAPTTVGAEQMSGRPDREIILERDVEITRGETTINADKAIYNVVEEEAEASGGVRIKHFGDRYTGDEAKLKLDTGQGYVTNPTYRLQLNNAQGQAERIDFEAQDRATVTEGTYSTCEGPDPDWYLRSSTLTLDTGKDIGTASKAIVYFKGVPILGTPQMSFPLSDARKSGVLPPTIGTTNRGGLEILVPYYFNIAPNRDLTVYPKIIAQRGVQLGAKARYLGETYSGETRIEDMPNDRLTGTSRYAISSTHTQTFAPGLTFASNLNAASDNNYPNDFPSTITTASQRLLLRDMNLSYAGSYWNAALRGSNYQVLQDPAAPIISPYDRLPQLTLQAGRQNVEGFDWSVNSELTRFWLSDPNVPDPTIDPTKPRPRGDRVMVNPRISYPMLHPGYFVTPSLSLNATNYSLADQAAGSPSTFTRVLPTFSVDSGLTFERDASFFGRTATQTLEPRLFYVYTPFRDQSLLPIFDTALADFNFTQIFSENRFSGYDRISDANQLTAALVSRFIETSGVERMRFALAQRYYFSPPRVTGTTLGVTGTTLATIPNETRSDLLLAASGQVSSTLNVDANTQYSQSLRRSTRANYGVRWQPAPKRVLNLQYVRDLPNSLEQVDASGQWPIAQRWYGVARVNYSLRDQKIAESLLGMEYKADCWVFRFVGQRTPTATGVATSAFFVQLELNGLSRLGSNPLAVLRSNVPGYQLINQP
ncbi:MAG TPA: LPS-assembly protein LptD [Burkholderiaceae bacterium]|jgi:LPS-assembly protein|nr:LPS-assembly protein LptD [Burkholderiaceae bacterium]